MKKNADGLQYIVANERNTKTRQGDAPNHCTAPVMWGNVRPWATMLGSSVLLWFEACIFMILTLDGNIFREKVR